MCTFTYDNSTRIVAQAQDEFINDVFEDYTDDNLDLDKELNTKLFPLLYNYHVYMTDFMDDVHYFLRDLLSGRNPDLSKFGNKFAECVLKHKNSFKLGNRQLIKATVLALEITKRICIIESDTLMFAGVILADQAAMNTKEQFMTMYEDVVPEYLDMLLSNEPGFIQKMESSLCTQLGTMESQQLAQDYFKQQLNSLTIEALQIAQEKLYNEKVVNHNMIE